MEDNEEFDSDFNVEDIPISNGFWNYMESYWHNNREFPQSTESQLNKKADLISGKVPASQLPSYVDDVLEFEFFETLPNPGEKGKIYVIVSDNTQYRWSGNDYVQINSADDLMTTDTFQEVTGIKRFINKGNAVDDLSLQIWGKNGAKAGVFFYSEGMDTSQINFDGYFNFKNQDDEGYRNIKAAGFIKDGYNNGFILLAGGGHVPISEFVLNSDFSNQLALVHKADVTGGIYNGSIGRTNKSWFDYNWAGTGGKGSVISFSGLGGAYSTEIFAAYNDYYTAIRSRNGDSLTWNDPMVLWHNKNFNPDDYALSHTLNNYIPYTGASQNVDLNNKNIFNINRVATNGSIKHNNLGLSLANASGSGSYSSVLIKSGLTFGNMGTYTVKIYNYAHEYFEFNVNNYKYNDSNYIPTITWKTGNSKRITRIEFLKNSNNDLYINVVINIAYPRVAVTDLMVYGFDDVAFDSNNWSIELGGSTTGLINEGQLVPANFLRDDYLNDIYTTQAWVQSQGYLTSASLNGFATENYLNNNFIPNSQKGTANGVATLGSSGLIPTNQLPSYVDDVLEFAGLSNFPTTGETGKIYVAIDTNQTYRWSGSAYIQIASGAVQSVNGQTGIVNLTKSDVGLGNVDNTSDAIKNVATARSLRNVNITLAQLNSVTLEPGIYNLEGAAPGQGLTSTYNYIIQLGSYGGAGGAYKAQIAMPYQNGINDSIYIRTSLGNDYGNWERIAKNSDITAAINALNLPSYGFLAQNYALRDGSNATERWVNSANGLQVNPTIVGKMYNGSGQSNLRDATYGQVMGYINEFGVAAGNPGDSWYYRMKFLHNNANGYYGELAVKMTDGNGLFYKRVEASTDFGWIKAWDDSNFTQTNINNWNTAHDWGNHELAGYLTSAGLNGYATESWVVENFPNQTLSVGTEGLGGQDLILSNASTVKITNNFLTSRDGTRIPNDIKPNENGNRVRFDFANAGTVGGSGNYAGVMTYSPWDGTTVSTGDSSYQLAFANQTGIDGSGIPMLKLRKGIDDAWSSDWYKMWSEGDFSQVDINNWNNIVNSAATQSWVQSQDYATNNFVETKIDELKGEIVDPAPGFEITNEFTTVIVTDNHSGGPLELEGELISKRYLTIINLSQNVIDLNRDAKTIDRIPEYETAEYYITTEKRLLKKGSYKNTAVLI
ncbi:hypothetical protein K0U91_05580 [Chryseobacterium chendengshani]|uniref:hypothetical protein n=1 Tax=Chryseobacterium sp. LJ668 TaxID=2864040 RepID=UPI001C68D6AE|nr:hypothetical protein [Chryseobacterium sp. LJ668]MBW8521939.1 hypothetical protein [Chryseobacterium sp. LJ668]QYK17595.1 hypothetical protein K0U91_05580 [Chryseobacterium sp. LJ668]